MSNNQPRRISTRRGVFEEAFLELRLVIRLLRDRRVHPLLKLIPLATLVYLINPVDIPTPIDDGGVILGGLVIFVELCPQAVVDEHRKALRRVVNGEWQDAPKEDVIEGEFREEK